MIEFGDNTIERLMMRARFLPTITSLALFLCGAVSAYQIRPATLEDVSFARTLLLKEAMNPLSVSPETLLVASDEDDGTNNSAILGFGQIRSIGSNCWELASLYVLPEQRSKGVGSALVQALLERNTELQSNSSNNNDNPATICLLTLGPTTKFYEPFGFQVATESERKSLPLSIQLEYKAGALVSMVLGNQIECMIKTN